MPFNNFPKHKTAVKKKAIQLLFLLFAFAKANAQTINTDSLSDYSPSVVIKVHEVGSKINLTIAEQKSLANLFMEEETTIRNLIASQATTNSINDAKSFYQYRFTKVLPNQLIDDYYKAVASQKANRIAKSNASFLQKKYSTNNIIKQYFNDMYSAKETLIQQALIRYSDTTIIDTNIYNVIQAYDTLLEKYLHLVKSQSFIEEKIQILKSINPSVDSIKLEHLKNTFGNLSLLHPNWALSDNFNSAFNFNFNEVADTQYYKVLYREQIVYNAVFTSQNAVEGYKKMYHLSNNGLNQLLPIVAKREYEIAQINKIFTTYSPLRDSIIDTIYNKYKTPIFNIISKYGISKTANLFELAIHFASDLQITEQQIENLSLKSKQYEIQKNDFDNINPLSVYVNNEFEAQNLFTILTAEQHTNLLTIRYKSVAQENADKDWKYLEEYGISTSLDINNTKTELTNYHLALFISYYRYAFDKIRQYTSINNINEIMPDAMRLLVERWTLKTPFEYNPDIFFQW